MLIDNIRIVELKGRDVRAENFHPRHEVNKSVSLAIGGNRLEASSTFRKPIGQKIAR